MAAEVQAELDTSLAGIVEAEQAIRCSEWCGGLCHFELHDE